MMQFCFDISCPFAYTASVAVARSPLAPSIEWTPVLLGALYGATAAPQGARGSASDVMNQAKRVVSRADLERAMERLGVSLRWPSRHPQSTVAALRTLVAVRNHADRVRLAAALYRAYWVHDRAVSDAGVVAAIFEETFPGSTWRAPVQADKDALAANTQRLLDAGGFGVPSFLVAGQMYWGLDRLLLASRRVDPSVQPLRLAPNWDGIRRTLVFYFDTASPWAYLGATQVHRVAQQFGARVELVPILLGALFKAIGSPNTPMDAMSPAKRAYLALDLQRWQEWWNLAQPVRFPDAFPLRTVLAQRVCIVSGAAMGPLYEAAWVHGENIGDEAVVVRALNAAGLDGAGLVAAASQDAVKKQLRDNTQRALAAGVCGVPTFQVDDSPIVWGQDRLPDVVADLLCGWKQRRRPKL